MTPCLPAPARARALVLAEALPNAPAAGKIQLGDHPETFIDTHRSQILGIGWTAVHAATRSDAFRKLMDAHRWRTLDAAVHDIEEGRNLLNLVDHHPFDRRRGRDQLAQGRRLQAEAVLRFRIEQIDPDRASPREPLPQKC